MSSIKENGGEVANWNPRTSQKKESSRTKELKVKKRKEGKEREGKESREMMRGERENGDS